MADRALGTPRETAVIQDEYDAMPKASLSRDVFERVPSRLAAVPVRDVSWSDWGREERVMETLSQLGKSLPPSGAVRGGIRHRVAAEL
jgi:hypothetical protein